MGIIKGALQFSLGMLFLEGLKLIFKRLIPVGMAGIGLSQGLGINPFATVKEYFDYYTDVLGYKLGEIFQDLGLGFITDFDYGRLWSTGGVLMILGAIIMVRTIFSRG